MTKDSEIYERWSQAISSAHELLTLAFNGETDTRTTGQKVFTAVLPAVVVPNGSLWTATYNADGKLMEDPKQADEAQYFVGQSSKSNPKFIFSHIHFLTMNGLSAFLGRMNSEDFYERVINRAAGRA